MVLGIVIRFVVCFALGSIPFAVVAMLGTGVDIRKVGSRNPGFNNVLRVNKKRAVLALIGDLGKGILAIWLVFHAWPAALSPIGGVALGWLYGFGAILGHCFSPVLKFDGGKGIATSAGVMLILYPPWAVIGVIYFTLARLTGSRLHWREAGTIASLTTWVLFTVLLLAFVGRQDALYAALMTLFLICRHHANLRRLFARAAPLSPAEVLAKGKSA